MTACLDRTADFNRLLIQFSQNNVNFQASSGSSFAPQQSEFNAHATQIGAAIEKTSLKVQELGSLSRGKGLFNDKTVQIQELQSLCQKEISALSQRIGILESSAAMSGSVHSQRHRTNLVEALKTRLLSLTNSFKNVLELRTKTLEQQSNRMNMYRSTPMQYTGNPNDLEGAGGMQDQTMEVVHSRAEALKKVQAMIGDMGLMFQKMGVMVQQQEEMVMRVDQNLDDTSENITKGQQQLLQYFNSVSNNRTLILKVFAILIAFIIFFIVFLA